jgi:hypothetical protein
MEVSMETRLAHQQIGWRWIAMALALAAILAGALIISVAPAQIAPPADTSVRARPEAASVSNSAPSDIGNVGNFAFGYVEFDWDPKAPGGVPGFDSWPPASPSRP